MLSKMELRALSEISRGAEAVSELSEALELSTPQTYKVIRSLREKDHVRFEHGTISIEKRTHVAILLNILNDSQISYVPLSDCGMEIIRTLTEPRTVSEISSMIGVHQTTVTRKIGRMRRHGMVRKEKTSYSINAKLWPRLVDLASSYNEYLRFTDPRAPFGSEIFYSSLGLVVFSSDRDLDDKKTAFSRYDDHGMHIYPGTYYYCTSDCEPTLKDIFLHSLYVVEKDRCWRSKMLALIFYVMHKNELNDVEHPVMNDIRTVLKGDRVEGWVPLREMQERAVMYEVDLYKERFRMTS